jgi:hypothetical protein
MKKAPKLRRWRIVLIRQRGQFVGTVEAADAESAIKVAIREYDITDSERQRRLIAQPMD